MKNITCPDETYGRLTTMKRLGESYSDVIETLSKRRKVQVSTFYGTLRDSNFLDELEEEVDEPRRGSSLMTF